ncbi:MAG: hypothetical protein IKU07_04305 [Oscillospiraceae bacterium]|nr:hypothetical protein [Oscillospiraceae bacterium]
MRDMKECLTEVFLRSEEKIKAGKRMRTVLTSVVLCLVLCMVCFLPQLLPGNSGEPGMMQGAGGTVGMESLTGSAPGITVTGYQFSKEFKGEADVLRITEALASYGTRGTLEDNYESFDSVSDSSNITTESSEKRTGYTVVITAADGSVTEYLFTENTLKNITTKETVSLSQKQTAELKALLGIG